MSEKKKKSSILANTLVLVLVTFVAVLALAVVNQVTRGPIEQAEIDARAEVYAAVYPNAQGFAEIENSEALIEGSAELLTSAGYDGCFVNDALAVTDASGNTEGYVIAATSPSGYGGNVQIAIGVKDGKLTGFDVVSQSETAGIGSKITEDGFKSQFAGKPATTLESTKSGANEENQIDAISGATISTGAAIDAVNAAIAFYQANFGGGLQAEEEVDPLQKAFPDADLNALTPVEVTNGEINENCTVNEVHQAGDMGYIVVATAHNGYDGDLQIALGIGNDGTIKGFSTVVCNETKTLGGQCTSDEFAQQFVGMTLKEVTHVPSGATPENNQIDAIAGATITTDAVLTGVNGAIEYYNSNIQKGE